MEFRAHPDQVERWEAQAEAAGVPLSTWIRGVLDGVYEVTDVVEDDKAE